MSRVISTSVLVSADFVQEVLCFMQEPFNDGVRQSPNFPGIFSGIQFCIFGDRKGTEKFSQDTQFCIGSYRFCWTTMTNYQLWQKSDVNAITLGCVFYLSFFMENSRLNPKYIAKCYQNGCIQKYAKSNPCYL